DVNAPTDVPSALYVGHLEIPVLAVHAKQRRDHQREDEKRHYKKHRLFYSLHGFLSSSRARPKRAAPGFSRSCKSRGGPQVAAHAKQGSTRAGAPCPGRSKRPGHREAPGQCSCPPSCYPAYVLLKIIPAPRAGPPRRPRWSTQPPRREPGKRDRKSVV